MDLPDSTGDLPESFSWSGSTAGETMVEGKIIKTADGIIERDSKFNEGVVQGLMFIVLEQPSGDEVTLWFAVKKDVDRNPLPDRVCQAITEAVKEATGSTTIQLGGYLKVKHTSDNDSGKGNAEKIYKAQYEAPVAGTTLPDDDSGF